MTKHGIQSVVSFLHLIILIGLLSACAADGDRMRQQLYDLQACNQADSLMTNDSLATALCTWFDSHGTPNERMLAHYLMGRTWADKGEAPQALEEYHTAAECADTTATDCDYRLLCRVYAQMSSIFYQQNLMEYYLNSLDNSIWYASKVNDIPVVLNSSAYKMVGYERMNLPDSVTTTYEKVYDLYCQENDTITGIRFFGLAFGSYVLTGQLMKARYYMEQYPRKLKM